MEHQENGQKLNRNYTDSEKCPVCNGTGLEIYRDDRGRTFSKMCRCGAYKKNQKKERLDFAKIPEGFRSLKLESFRSDIYEDSRSKTIIQKNLKAANWWLENFERMQKEGKGLYLYSSTKGCGKTRFAVSIANELIESMDCSVKFATSIQIINEIKATWNKEYEYTEQQLLEELARVDVLIIDDFDTETPKDWIEERFYQIINERYMNNLITIFTSNNAIQNTDYDERIKNRIIEKSYCLLFPDESIREQIGKKNQEELKAAIA